MATKGKSVLRAKEECKGKTTSEKRSVVESLFVKKCTVFERVCLL